MADSTQAVDLYRLHQLTLNRGGGSPLLHVDDAFFPAGQFVCLTGPSGAGKSSLLFALAGLNRNLSGSIMFHGSNLAGLSSTELAALRRTSLGIVFQHFQLFDELNAFDNASMQALWGARSNRRKVEERVGELLSKLQINDLSSPCAQLSGGERQRVAVARALASNASVLLADEPTASLDRQTGAELITLLMDNTVGIGRTLIACSHDPAMVERADSVWSLGDGGMQRIR